MGGKKLISRIREYVTALQCRADIQCANIVHVSLCKSVCDLSATKVARQRAFHAQYLPVIVMAHLCKTFREKNIDEIGLF